MKKSNYLASKKDVLKIMKSLIVYDLFNNSLRVRPYKFITKLEKILKDDIKLSQDFPEKFEFPRPIEDNISLLQAETFIDESTNENGCVNLISLRDSFCNCTIY